MQVIDHRPGAWFLLADGDELFLDVNCSYSVVSYTVLIELNHSERTHYEQGGHDWLSQLAQKVNDSAPAARESTSPFRERDLSKARSHEVVEAVRRWRSETQPPA